MIVDVDLFENVNGVAGMTEDDTAPKTTKRKRTPKNQREGKGKKTTSAIGTTTKGKKGIYI
jgi:hypothetical protein